MDGETNGGQEATQGSENGTVKILAHFPTAPRLAIRCGYSSSSVTSRYRLELHSLSATYLSRAVASMRADLPSGGLATLIWTVSTGSAPPS